MSDLGWFQQLFGPIRAEKFKVVKFEGYYCRRYYEI